MRYRSRTQHQQEFRPVVVVLANNILPLWYLEKAYEAIKPGFQMSVSPVEVDIEKAFVLCKKLAKGQYKNVVWIIDIEPLLQIAQNKGNDRDETVARLQGMLDEVNANPMVKVVLNNPTFELWLQLHFEAISKGLETTGDAVKSRIERLIPGYKREQSFYHDAENIYMKMQGRMAAANIHANSLMMPDFPELKYARTMMPVAMSIFD